VVKFDLLEDAQALVDLRGKGPTILRKIVWVTSSSTLADLASVLIKKIQRYIFEPLVMLQGGPAIWGDCRLGVLKVAPHIRQCILRGRE
jgi:hypothetical protein